MIGTLSKAQIEHVLQRQVIGRIACYAADDLYIVPITYVYDGKYLYAHSRQGMKIDMMRKNPSICFQVDIIENMANWQSVIIWGVFEELKKEQEQAKAMKLLMDRFSPLLTSDTVRLPKGHDQTPKVVEKAAKAIVYRISISKMTGRFEKQ